MPPKTATPAVVPASSVPLISYPQAFDPAKYVTKSMDLEQVKKLKEIFDVFDADNSGQISIPEIVDTIKALNLEKDAQNIISMVESSTSAEQLDFAAFIEIFGQSDNQSESSLKQLYEVFDPTGSGCFGAEDFEKVCELVGEKFTPQ